LQTFTCFQAGLTELPKEFELLVNLKHISIQDNKLAEFPASLLKLTKLEYIDCSCNQITELSKEIERLSNLETFIFYSNQISELPIELFNLTNLKILHCSYNKISVLPKQIGLLVNLTELSIAENQLTELPCEIIHLKQLVKINFACNSVSKVPEREILDLDKLTLIVCYSNPLSASFVNLVLTQRPDIRIMALTIRQSPWIKIVPWWKRIRNIFSEFMQNMID